MEEFDKAGSSKPSSQESGGGDGDASAKSNNNNKCTTEDLIDLVRAVKFAHPEMSIRGAHREISEIMACADPFYTFLKDVKLNDVKKVWKNALKAGGGGIGIKASATVGGGASGKARPAADAVVVAAVPLSPPDGVLKFYTVGDGSVKTLAENYANRHAGAAIAEELDCEVEGGAQEGGGEGTQRYVHYFLDVPADRSGSRPHQALINFNDNRKGRVTTGGKGKKKCKTRNRTGGNSSCDEDCGRHIVKIQLAAQMPGEEDVPPLMLLYNANRSAKTFLHPPSSPDDRSGLDKDGEDDGGYEKIKRKIVESGASGALGATGGQKAYFWSVVTKTKKGPDVISIDIVSELAVPQSW